MLGARPLLQAGETLLVDLAVVTLAVVDDRFRELGENLRWHGSWPRRQQVALLRHLTSVAQEAAASQSSLNTADEEVTLEA
jgi:hypothetical protein